MNLVSTPVIIMRSIIALTALLGYIALVETAKNSMFSTYVGDENIDTFCDSLQESYNMECIDEVPPELQTQLAQVLRRSTTAEAVEYITDNLVKHPADLELDEEECRDLKDLALEEDTHGVAKVIQEHAVDRGYTFKPSKIRSLKTLRSKAKRMAASNSCNLEALGGYFGNLKGSYLKSVPKVEVPSAMPYIMGAIDFVKSQLPTPESKVDAALKERIREEQTEIQKESEILKEIRDKLSSCHVEKRETDCVVADRRIRDYVMDKLGVEAIRIIEDHPGSRNFFFYVARIWVYLTSFSLRRSLGLTADLLSVLMDHPWIGLAIAFAIYYRGEASSFMAFILSATGLGIVPILSITRRAAYIVGDRMMGMTIMVAIAAIAAARHLDRIDTVSASLAVYMVVFFYLHVIEGNMNTKKLVLSLFPFAMYILYKGLSQGEFVLPPMTMPQFDAFTSNSWSAQNFLWWIIGSAQMNPLAAVAMSLCLTIYMLCGHCDVIGSSTYKDVVNKTVKNKQVDWSVPKPTVTDYLGSMLNSNTNLMMAIIAIPNLLNVNNWIIFTAVILFAWILSALIYHSLFHEEYVREAHSTSSAVDRIVASSNIIAGIAPKNVVLPRFNATVVTILTMIAFVTGCRIDLYVGVMAGFIICCLLLNDKTKIDTAAIWCSGTTIMVSGTILHGLTGLIFVIVKANKKLRLYTSNMQVGETIREVSTDHQD